MTKSAADWFCIRTNIKCENRARDGLEDLGLETYLPLHRRLRKSRFRRVGTIMAMLPLMPRYLFMVDPGERGFYDIRRTDGVEAVVGINGRPIPIRASELMRFKELVDTGTFDEVGADRRRKKLSEGEYRMELSGGRLIPVIVTRHDGGHEAVIEFDFLGFPQVQKVSIDRLSSAA